MRTWADLGIDVPPQRTTGEFDTPCPHCSPTRKKRTARCLSVNLDKGVALCHHCGWTASLTEARTGQVEPAWCKPVHRAPPPRVPMPPNAGAATNTMLAWFEARGIPLDVIVRNKIHVARVYMPQLEDHADVVVFPYYRNGELVNRKYRTLVDKHFRMDTGAERLVYKHDDLSTECTLICEGELDALALDAAGFPHALSVPDGAPSPETKDYASKFTFLDTAAFDPVSKFVLAVDSDAPGQRLEDELARRLGRERCWLVRWPPDCKDANEVLLRHGVAGVRACVAAARECPIEGVFSADDHEERVVQLYEQGYLRGQSTGWKTLDQHYTVRPGELTVIVGVPGSGKSNFVDALIVNLAEQQGWGFALFSPENQPIEDHVARLVEKRMRLPFRSGPTPRMSRADLAVGLQWVHGHFWWMLPDEANWHIEWILGRAKELVVRQGIRGLVIDPWNEIEPQRDPRETETEYVSRVLRTVRQWARRHGVHVWMVVHPAKLYRDKEGKYPVPTLYDAHGCHDAATEVLTRRGWVRHAEVQSSDEVCCFDAATSTLRYAQPTAIWRAPYRGEMVRIKSDSLDACVTPEHTIVMKPAHQSGRGRPFRWDERTWNRCTAADLSAGIELFVPWATPLADERVRVESVTIGNACVDVNDLMRLVGWWVSEGSLNHGGALLLSQRVGELAARMDATLQRMGLHVTATEQAPGTGGTHRIRNFYISKRAHPALCEWVATTCGVGARNKRLPAPVWTLSRAQKTILLEALIDGDGTRKRRGNASYSTTSARLADEVQRLAIECGRMAHVGSRAQRNPKHARYYWVSIGSPRRREIGLRSARHVSRVPYDGDVFCLTVPTGAYVTRRNGRPGIWGNSAHWRNKCDCGLAIARDFQAPSARVDVYIQKIRFRQIGTVGKMQLLYDPVTARYDELYMEDARGDGANGSCDLHTGADDDDPGPAAEHYAVTSSVPEFLKDGREDDD